VSRVVEVKLRLPSDLASIVAPRRLEDEAKLLIALELYREGKVSLGKAAEIAGLSVREFMYELRARRIPLNYDVGELEYDLEIVDELARRMGGKK